MASRSPTEQLLFDYVNQFAYPPSDDEVQRCWQRCDDHGHLLIGPVLQYKIDNYNLGRWVILCKGKHPGDPVQPGRLFKFVSKAQSSGRRRQIRDFRIANGIKADGSPAKKKNAQNGAAQANAEVIDLTLSSTPPPQAPPPLPHSPSIEIISVVPAPVLFDKLDVWYFSENKKAPLSFTLKARPIRPEFRLRQYENTLHAMEIKQTDLITVLTTATSGVQTWSAFRVSDLAIPRTQSVIVLSRRCVTDFHPSFSALYEHAYPGAAHLPGRILPLP
ncbi:hypothetical protein PENSPDRAFT_694841 [Peniophora sp. CONT]|nr:hypothetical protein PENSPDRAFT_694841 [Peniophora sp. CONT]